MAQAWFLPHRRHAWKLGALLVLTLVFAQISAIVHVYSHVGAHHAGPEPGCPDCLSFAPLLAAAGASGKSPTVARANPATTYRTLTAPLDGQTPQHSFRSRGPPSPV